MPKNRPHSPKPPAGRIQNLAKRTLVEENGIHIPKTFVSIFRVHFELAH